MVGYRPGDFVKIELSDEQIRESEWLWLRVDRCDTCGGAKAVLVRSTLFQCTGCRHQTSVTAGTVAARSGPGASSHPDRPAIEARPTD